MSTNTTGTTYTYGQLCKKFHETPIQRKGLTASEYNTLKEKHIQQISKKINQSIIISQDSNKHTYYYINLKPEPKRLLQKRISQAKKLSRGAIITIPPNPTYSIQSPITIDLESRPYTNTNIETYILYLIFNLDPNYITHLSEFYTLCLHSCGLYSQLLYKYNNTGIQTLQRHIQQRTYKSIVIQEGFNIILERLQSKIYDTIIKFQEKGIITVDTKYPFTSSSRQHPFGYFDTSFVDEYGEIAKHKLNFYKENKNGEKINYTNNYIYKSGLWKQFTKKRLELIQQDYQQEYPDLKIKNKVWEATPNSNKNIEKPKLTHKQQEQILYLFFETFREKLKYDIQHGKITIKDLQDDLKEQHYLKTNFLKDVYSCYENFLFFDREHYRYFNPLDFQIDNFAGEIFSTNFSWNNGTYILNRVKNLYDINSNNE